MQYTVETDTDGLVFYGDPPWTHVATIVDRAMADRSYADLPVLGPEPLVDALARTGRRPALVVCWSEQSRIAWLQMLAAPDGPQQPTNPYRLDHTDDWHGECAENSHGHDWRQVEVKHGDGKPHACWAFCANNCGAHCLPHECEWADHPLAPAADDPNAPIAEEP